MKEKLALVGLIVALIIYFIESRFKPRLEWNAQLNAFLLFYDRKSKGRVTERDFIILF